jgi:uncharacterized OB-fold protein
MPDAIAAGATGTLVTFTIIRKAPAAFAADGVYAVAVVDLADDGAVRRVVGRIEPFEPAPRLGARVRLARWLKDIPVFTVD